MRRAPIIPAHTIHTYTDASSLVVAQPGDLMVCATGGKVGAAIRLITRGWCNHAAVVVGVTATMVPIVSQETPGGGDVFTAITDLDATRIAVISIEMDDTQRAAVVAFANWAGGSRYGFAACVGDVLGEVLHVELGLGIGTHMNCSEQTTRAGERTGWVPSRSPESMRPIDVARDFGIGAWPVE